MLKFTTRIITAFILAMFSIVTAVGQESQTPAPAAKSPEHVTEKGFRSRVFEIKHRNPDSLVDVIRPLGSGFKGAMYTTNHSFKTITVRDFPENVAVIEEALKRLDTPEAPQAAIELHMHVLIASNTEGTTEQFPAELKDVTRQLQSTLNYKGYRLVASIVNRVKEGPRGARGEGLADLSAFTTTPASRDIYATYGYNINHISLSSTPTGTPVVQLGNLDFALKTNAFSSAFVETGVHTATNVRDGEKVVVGTASLKDKGLILVLSAKVIK